MIDYKELLEKYMSVVVMTEGTACTGYCTERMGFNEYEVKELVRISEDVYESFGAQPRDLTPDDIKATALKILGWSK